MQELEFTPQLIARLVLGYLRDEKCGNAYKQFLAETKHLKEYTRKKIATRVAGLTLADYLTEFGKLNMLIQERLEDTDFYSQQHSKCCLAEQLEYVLNYYEKGARTSPARNRSPALRISDVGVNTDFEEIKNAEVNTTPLESLPGNYSPSHRKSKEQVKHSGKTKDGDACHVDVKVLTSTLLEHHELHEKLADTIITVRKTPETSSSSVEKNNSTAVDIEAAIKTVVQKTTRDPIFDRLVKEIIGEDEDECDGTNTQVAGQQINADTLSHEAVNSNVPPNETQKDQIISTTTALTPKKQLSLCEASLEPYLKLHPAASSAAATTPSNPMLLSSNGLLMLNPTPSVDVSKPYYVITSTPQGFSGVGNVLNEQDILTMPIVVCEDKHEKQDVNQIAIPSTASSLDTPRYLLPAVFNNESPVSCVQPYQTEQQKSTPLSKSAKKTKILPKASLNKTGSVKVHIPIKSQKKTTTEQHTVAPADESKNKPPEPVPYLATPANDNLTESDGKKTTPRSGSHIRTLNFSTPQKISEDQTEQSSSKVLPENSATVKVAKALFADSQVCTENEPSKKEAASSWDSDLRGLIAIQNECLSEAEQITKKKKKTDLNVTSEEGRLLENALLALSPDCNETAAKSVVEKKAESDKSKKMTKHAKKKGDDRRSSKTRTVKKSRKRSPQKTEQASCSKIEQLKSSECTEDAANKLILSPSKLNANKRSIIDPTDASDTNKPSTKRNITPMLETPVKPSICPKTPGFFSPVSNKDTPFTKVLKEQLDGIDITTIPTPKFPVTPSFPFTPPLGSTQYQNRPTDYSSSSSYYQPSDTENNKSLEQLIEECNRLEKYGNDVPPEKQIKVLSEVRIGPDNSSGAVVNYKANEIHAVVGRKNLKLVESVDLSVSDSSSSSSSDENDDGSFSGNKTVITEMATPSATHSYSLRTRKAADKNSSGDNITIKEDNADKSSIREHNTNQNVLGKEHSNDKRVTLSEHNTETITSILSSVEVKATLTSTVTKIDKGKVLLEMEEKRKRTVQQLDSEQNKVKNKPLRNEKGRFAPKPQNKLSHKSKTKKNVKKEPKQQLEPFEVVEAELHESLSSIPNVDTVDKKEAADEATKDNEAEKLVKDLKERGIHLVHNKTPKKPPETLHTDKKVSKAEPETTETKAQPEQKHKNKETDKNSSATHQSVLEKDLELSYPEEKDEDSEFSAVLDLEFGYYRSVEPTLCLTYDSDNTNRSVEDYDFGFLTKEFEASVYLAESDIEVQRVMTCSAFESVLDIPSSSLMTAIPRRKQSTKKQATTCKTDNTASPLDNLYESENSGCSRNAKLQNADPNSSISKAQIVKKRVEKSPHPKRRARSLSTPNQKVKRDDRDRERLSSEPASIANSQSREIKQDVVDGIIILSSSSTEQIKNVEEEDDDLMNFAVAGSPTKSTKKRKASVEVESSHQGKKNKTEKGQQLLKHIDVDSFLTHLHGDK